MRAAREHLRDAGKFPGGAGYQEMKRHAVGMMLGGLIADALGGGKLPPISIEVGAEADETPPCFIAEAARKAVETWQACQDCPLDDSFRHGKLIREHIAAIDELARLLERHP